MDVAGELADGRVVEYYRRAQREARRERGVEQLNQPARVERVHSELHQRRVFKAAARMDRQPKRMQCLQYVLLVARGRGAGVHGLQLSKQCCNFRPSGGKLGWAAHH